MLNIERIQKIASALGELNNQVVYVGGAVVELYIENPELAEVRPTMDIDCVTQFVSRTDFWKFEEQLRKKGFSNDQTPGSPICRWTYDDEIVDIMPDDPSILGFSNRWYLKEKFHAILQRPNIHEEVETALPYDEADRTEIILGLMKSISREQL